MSSCELWTIAIRPIQPRAVRCLSWRRIPAFVELQSCRASGRTRTRKVSQLATLPSETGSQTIEQTSLLFQRTETILSKSLPLDSPLLYFWNGALKSAQHRLSDPGVKARVVVYGIDKYSASQDLVTVLLDDPLSSNNEQRVRLHSRWQDANNEPIHYEYDQKYSRSNQYTRVEAPWLERLSISLTELPMGQLADHLNTLFNADIPIIVANPCVTQIPELISVLPPNPHTILVFNSALGSRMTRYIEAEVKRNLNGRPLRVLFIDIERALRSLETLRANPTSSAIVRQYQDDFLGSQMLSLSTVLQDILQGDSASIQIRCARALLKGATAVSRIALQTAFQEVDTVQLVASNLRSRMLEEHEKVMKEILGGSGEGVVESAVEKAGKDVKVAMDALTWWRLPLRVDDISRTVSNAVETSSLRAFEDKLIFQTGRLASLQAELLEFSIVQIKSLPSSFDSPVLSNTLAQLSASPSFPLSTTSLTNPLHTRRTQLTYATNRLHLAGQRAVLGTTFFTLASTAGMYCVWLVDYVDGATACGTGAFAGMLALRWAVWKWERAKIHWWRDWDRVGQGLGRDMKKTLQTCMECQVVLVPAKASEELQKLAKNRTTDIDSLGDTIENLESDLSPNSEEASSVQK